MRMVLRVYSTAEYDEEEGRLQVMVYDVLGKIAFPALGRIADEERSPLLIRFVERWRSGRLTGFGRGYVRWALTDVRRREVTATSNRIEGGQEQSEAAHDHRGFSPDVIVQVQEIESRFRESLTKDIERELFGAWIESGNRQGWQREFAEERGKSDTWVSNVLKRFRERLQRQYDIRDPDAFVELLALLRDDAEDEPPAADEEPVEEETSGERALLLRERLRESFAQGSPERQLFDDCSAGYTREEIQRRYPDEEELLLRLHEQYVNLGKELASELKHAQEAADHE
jgi:hypothetical protein